MIIIYYDQGNSYVGAKDGTGVSLSKFPEWRTIFGQISKEHLCSMWTTSYESPCIFWKTFSFLKIDNFFFIRMNLWSSSINLISCFLFIFFISIFSLWNHKIILNYEQIIQAIHPFTVIFIHEHTDILGKCIRFVPFVFFFLLKYYHAIYHDHHFIHNNLNKNNNSNSKMTDFSTLYEYKK